MSPIDVNSGDKMLKRATDSKFSSSVLPVDTENYMLRGISRPAIAEATISDGDMDHKGLQVRDNGVGGCARILSFHSLLCTCEATCCCKCGTLCSADCHACFHNYCLKFFPDYLCQKDNDVLPPVTLDYDKIYSEVYGPLDQVADNSRLGEN